MSDDNSLSSGGDQESAPSRFVDLTGRPGEPDSLERRAGALLREVNPPPTLTAAGLARVRMRLDRSIRSPATGPAGHRWRPVVRWVLVGALMLFGSGVVAAARGWAPRWPILTALLPHAATLSSEQRTPRREIRRSTPAVPPAVVAPATAPVADPQPTLAPTVSPPPITPNPSPRRRSTAVAERALLERAVMALRQKRDPGRTLALLDDYEARFSTRVLAPEVARLRIDALLLAGRRRRALDALNRLALSEGARDLELGLIRGELRAAAGDCAHAVGDFDRVLALASDGSTKRRAAAGRAACLGKF